MKYCIHIIIGMLLVSSFLSSCDSNEKKEMPEYVIPRESLIDLLVEMHMAEAVLDKKQGHKADVTDYSHPYYKAIFDSFHTSPSLFDTNVAYYQQDMDDFLEIYNQVMIKLTKRNDEVPVEEKSGEEKK
ncbi:MAG: DUF4296 domain-containing protein [Bacteroidales bacterium]|nr:DUF4296 domain-containing protein [Bacteroidales bacterium]